MPRDHSAWDEATLVLAVMPELAAAELDSALAALVALPVA